MKRPTVLKGVQEHDGICHLQTSEARRLIHMRFPVELVDAVDAVAQSEGMSRTSFVEDALIRNLSRYGVATDCAQE